MDQHTNQTGSEQELLANELGAFSLFDGQDENGNEGPAEYAESSKQARVRRAVEQAKREFEPVREDLSWFIAPELLQILQVQLHQLPREDAQDQWQDAPLIQINSSPLDNYIKRQFAEDSRASHKLDWTLSALYANNCLKAALTLALALLRTVNWSTDIASFTIPGPSDNLASCALLNDLSTDIESAGAGDQSTKKGKHRIKTTLFAYDKEAHDVVMCCLIKIIPQLREEKDQQMDEVTRLAWLIACQSSRLCPQEGLKEVVCDGTREIPNGWQNVHWTNTPGLALSLGHLCAALEHWRGATSAYALYIGARGPLRIAARHVARALAQLVPDSHGGAPSAGQVAIKTLSQAFACAYIGATSPQKRPVAIQEVREGQVIPVSFLPDSDTSELVDADTEDTLRALLEWTLFPPESAIALVRCGPTKKTPMAQCVQRLAEFLSGSGADGADGEDDEQFQIRSVRTL